MTAARILIVCTGNICRSAFAELLLGERLRSAGRVEVAVRSAGTTAVVGDPVHPLAARELEQRGAATLPFEARQVSASMVAEADLILGMTRAHRGRLLDLEPAALRRTFTFREFVALLGNPSVPSAGSLGELARAAYLARTSMQDVVNGPAADVADPYGGTEADFAHMARVLDAGTDAIVRALAATEAVPFS